MKHIVKIGGLGALLSVFFLFGLVDSAQAETDRIITSYGSGFRPFVKAFSSSGVTDSTTNFNAYAEAFTGGVNVATGDIDGDGVDEIITGAAEGGGPHLRLFERNGTLKPLSFFPFHMDFRGGLSVAAGDTDGDGVDEIGVCQSSDGQAWFKVYEYNEEHTTRAYGNAFGDPEVGCSIAMADVDADGKDEIVIGAGPGGGPHVRVYDVQVNSTVVYQPGSPQHPGLVSGASRKPISFFAFDIANRSGVDVAGGDVDGDGKDEIAVSQREGDEKWVKVYRYDDEQTVIGNFRAGNVGDETGAYIDLGDVNDDGKDDLIVGSGNGGRSFLRTYQANGTKISDWPAHPDGTELSTSTYGARPAFGTF